MVIIYRPSRARALSSDHDKGDLTLRAGYGANRANGPNFKEIK